MSMALEVAARRRSLGLTQRDVAELAGVSERFVRLLEAGKATVRIDKLGEVLAVLGLEVTTRLRQVAP